MANNRNSLCCSSAGLKQICDAAAAIHYEIHRRVPLSEQFPSAKIRTRRRDLAHGGTCLPSVQDPYSHRTKNDTACEDTRRCQASRQTLHAQEGLGGLQGRGHARHRPRQIRSGTSPVDASRDGRCRFARRKRLGRQILGQDGWRRLEQTRGNPDAGTRGTGVAVVNSEYWARYHLDGMVEWRGKDKTRYYYHVNEWWRIRRKTGATGLLYGLPILKPSEYWLAFLEPMV